MEMFHPKFKRVFGVSNLNILLLKQPKGSLFSVIWLIWLEPGAAYWVISPDHSWRLHICICFIKHVAGTRHSLTSVFMKTTDFDLCKCPKKYRGGLHRAGTSAWFYRKHRYRPEYVTVYILVSFKGGLWVSTAPALETAGKDLDFWKSLVLCFQGNPSLLSFCTFIFSGCKMLCSTCHALNLRPQVCW